MSSSTTTSSSSSSSPFPLTTPLTSLLDIPHPILLAGMAHTATAPLAAAVSLAGGLGVLGGLTYTPTTLRAMIRELKDLLLAAKDKPENQSITKEWTKEKLPFGIDLALPQVGGSARKTNHDYTHGQLDELIDVIIEEKARLFVSAVGVPPSHVIEKLHANGILIMNMVGHPKHAVKAFDAGVDIVCAQGGEGGGHTGDVSGNILIPSVVDVARSYKPKLLGGGPGLVVAAGGIWDGRGLASALVMGAVGVWVGTRFVASEEAGCSRAHKEAVVSAGLQDTLRTIIVSGRPLRVRRNDWVDGWENKPEEIKKLTDQGIVPLTKDLENDDVEVDFPYLMGQVAGAIGDIRPAGDIVKDMVQEAVGMLNIGHGYLGQVRRDSKL